MLRACSMFKPHLQNYDNTCIRNGIYLIRIRCQDPIPPILQNQTIVKHSNWTFSIFSRVLLSHE